MGESISDMAKETYKCHVGPVHGVVNAGSDEFVSLLEAIKWLISICIS